MVAWLESLADDHLKRQGRTTFAPGEGLWCETKTEMRARPGAVDVPCLISNMRCVQRNRFASEWFGRHGCVRRVEFWLPGGTAAEWAKGHTMCAVCVCQTCPWFGRPECMNGGVDGQKERSAGALVEMH